MKKTASKKRKMPLCRYDMQSLNEAMLAQGLSTKTLADMIKAKFGKEAPVEREVYYVMTGDRKFPRPEYIQMIAKVLGVDLQNFIKAA